ncbi:hypothetical protein LX16_2066 [Stackebrandtia albiflava]|uniref:MOSC domain-containing protein n=1 Tax=Stackebrandtia albiflava TaxID=406432 RepID=A0A562VET9_9ACTN|nr:MOSC N-terminal beta barrel domain-containing protein [Stackebrandtia albiflava]TWJ16337.1 hypothetical protein LX16_2066 [Stackebrandtia albiflava]
MRIVSLHVHPMKSIAPNDVAEAAVAPYGLAGDRRLLLVDRDGAQVTAREHPRLLRVRAAYRMPDVVDFHAPGGAGLTVRLAENAPRRAVSVFGTRFTAADCGEAAAAWFTGLLGIPVRLTHQDDPASRRVGHPAGRPGEVVSTADAFPILLTSTTSLDRLNEWVTARQSELDEPVEPVPMSRFRPNVVVDSPVPFAETGWRHVTVAGLGFRVAAECDRCVMTTIAPETGDIGREPLRSLAKHRRRDGASWFGIYLVPLETGTIRVGDDVVAG